MAEARHAFGCQHTDDLAGELPQTDSRAYGILATEKLAAHGAADDTHGLAGPLLPLAEIAPEVQ